MILVANETLLGGGGGGGRSGWGPFKKCIITNDSTTKLMVTGHKYPEHKLAYVSQKILALIV